MRHLSVAELFCEKLLAIFVLSSTINLQVLSLIFDLYYNSCTLYLCTLDIFSCDNMFAETCPKILSLKFLDTVYSSSFF